MADTNYEDKICEAIEYIVDDAVKKAGYDKTIRAKVLYCEDASIGKYKVRYQDSSFYAFAENTDITYVQNAEVYVLVPGNDMRNEKKILGTTKKLGINYIYNPEDKDENFEIIGTNCIESQDKFELCSYSSGQNIIYDRDNSSNDKIRLILKSVERYIKEQSSTILIGGMFRTNLPAEQRLKGNYGIVFELAFEDAATGNTIIREYKLDVNDIVGQPYNIPRDTRQVAMFDIDRASFLYVQKAYIFVEDFPHQVPNKPKDIFISNLEFSGYNALTQTELSSCSLSFITVKGTYFDDTDNDNDIRSIEAQVRVKGKIIDKSSQQLFYYWFREDLTVTQSNQYYNKYGGQGWKCLNKFNIIQDGTGKNDATVEWVPDSYIYNVAKKDSLAKETKYKCVALYNNVAVSKEIVITNYSSEYTISIVSDSGTQFYYDIGTPSLTCLVNDSELLNDDYTYVWARIDNLNDFYGLAETSGYNTDYNDAVKNRDKLIKDIEDEKRLPNEASGELDSYLTIIENYDKILRVEKNKLHKIQINTIENFANFKCAVYYKGVYIGTGLITLKNSFEENGYSLIINNGTQVFKYDEMGISPASDTLDNPITIKPLSFVIYDNLGNLLPDDVLKECEKEWIVPSKNTLLSIPSGYGDGIPDLIGENKIYKKFDIFTYNIASKYMISKNRNNIKLKVTYKGMTLITETNFTFIKEGDPGTNGTEFVCKIVPNTDKKPYYPTITNGKINYNPKQSNVWFAVQLWHNGEKIFENSQTSASTENKNVTVIWGMLKNKYTSAKSDVSTIDINDITGECIYTKPPLPNNRIASDIVKCTVMYDNITYYATLPVITVEVNDGYDIKLKDYTGFKYAVYTSDGRTASYDNANPFELEVLKTIDGIQEDVSRLESSPHRVDYEWNILGDIYDPIAEVFKKDIHLSIVNRTGLERNQKWIKPIDYYNGECVNNAIECTINAANGSLIGIIHIPIHLLLNRYGQAALNDWDGNSIQLDNEGGVILSPQIGAGKKNKDNNNNDNSFTGILMGEVKESGQNSSEIGLFGYDSGSKTFFLNSEDGSVILGKADNGQIILDPTQQRALIYSHNFWEKYDKATGKPINYTPANENKKGTNNDPDSCGLLIDLTTPEIRYGSGYFSVDKHGWLKSTRGTIAGWEITDEALRSTDKDYGASVTINKNGNIDCTAGKKWYIHNDGTASFGMLKINTDGSVEIPGGFKINQDLIAQINKIQSDVINLQDSQNKNSVQINSGGVYINGTPAATTTYTIQQAQSYASAAEDRANTYASGQATSAKNAAINHADGKFNDNTIPDANWIRVVTDVKDLKLRAIIGVKHNGNDIFIKTGVGIKLTVDAYKLKFNQYGIFKGTTDFDSKELYQEKITPEIRDGEASSGLI